MNINDDYQKCRGQIISFPTGGIIEPNRKYLESNSFYPPTLFDILENTWDNIGKYIEGINLNKKRPLFLEVSLGFLLNLVFPCFHCFSKTTPSHLHKVFHVFLIRGRGEWNVT